jgi:hypothetical protein
LHRKEEAVMLLNAPADAEDVRSDVEATLASLMLAV